MGLFAPTFRRGLGAARATNERIVCSTVYTSTSPEAFAEDGRHIGAGWSQKSSEIVEHGLRSRHITKIWVLSGPSLIFGSSRPPDPHCHPQTPHLFLRGSTPSPRDPPPYRVLGTNAWMPDPGEAWIIVFALRFVGHDGRASWAGPFFVVGPVSNIGPKPAPEARPEEMCTIGTSPHVEEPRGAFPSIAVHWCSCFTRPVDPDVDPSTCTQCQ